MLAAIFAWGLGTVNLLPGDVEVARGVAEGSWEDYWPVVTAGFLAAVSSVGAFAHGLHACVRDYRQRDARAIGAGVRVPLHGATTWWWLAAGSAAIAVALFTLYLAPGVLGLLWGLLFIT